MIAELMNAKGALTDIGKLHVVDFGCGALAMQFGATIVVAMSLIRGENIREAIVNSIDINQAMLIAGWTAWEHFIDAVRSNKNLIAVAESCQLTKFDLHTRQDAVLLCDGECWLSCLHGVYQQNSNDLECAHCMTSIISSRRLD